MKIISLMFLTMMMFSGSAQSAEYVIDKKGMHAFIQFKISHLGYSWLWGRFNDFSGRFSYDSEKPGQSKISVVIKTSSVDSNHGERDKHLRGDEFLDVKKYPDAKFESTSITLNDQGEGVMKGQFTLRGVTRTIALDIKKTGEGKDPWGGYRAGFEGRTKLALVDYGIVKNLGPASKEVELILSIEGVRQ